MCTWQSQAPRAWRVGHGRRPCRSKHRCASRAGMRRIHRARRHVGRCSESATWRTVSIAWCSIAGGVSPPMCGVAITRGWRASAGAGIWSGARPTSSAQPARWPAVERVRAAPPRRPGSPRDALMKKAPRLHRREGRGVHQVLGLRRWPAPGRRRSRTAASSAGSAHLLQRRAPCDCGVRIGDQHAHAEGLRELGQVAADLAVADDAERRRRAARGPCAAPAARRAW